MDRPKDTGAGSRGDADRPSPRKDADAYRTIGEVAEDLKLPQHVLRFWETRFPQIRPLKRAGGRRFYRPEDVALLRAVQALLYGEGYTIKGVQRLFGEFGARQVSEALARSTRMSVEGEGRAPCPDRDEGAASAMPNDRSLEHRSPTPAVPGPSRPSARPAGEALSPIRAGSLADMAARLENVRAELSECDRLLSGLRSTRN